MTPCLLKNDPVSNHTFLLLKQVSCVGVAKASLNRAFLKGMVDPKLGELTMSRVNFIER